MVETPSQNDNVTDTPLDKESDLPAFLRQNEANLPVVTSVEESKDSEEIKKIEDRTRAADVLIDERNEAAGFFADKTIILEEDQENLDRLRKLSNRALKTSEQAKDDLQSKLQEFQASSYANESTVQERDSSINELKVAKIRLANQEKMISDLAGEIRKMSDLDKFQHFNFGRYAVDFIRENRALPKGINGLVEYIASQQIISRQGEDHNEVVAVLEEEVSELTQQLRAFDESKKQVDEATEKYRRAFQAKNATGLASNAATIDASIREKDWVATGQAILIEVGKAEDALKEHWKGLSESLYKTFTTDEVNGRVKKNEFSKIYAYNADSQSIELKSDGGVYKPLNENVEGAEVARSQEAESLNWTMGDLFSGYAGAELKKVVEYIQGNGESQRSPNEQLQSAASVLDRASGHAVRLSELASTHLENKKAFAEEILENIAAERKTLEEELIHENDWLVDAYVEHGVLSEEQISRKISLYPEADAIRTLQQKIEGFIPEGAVYKPATLELFRTLCNENAAKNPTFDLVKRLKELDIPFFKDKSRGSAGAMVDKLVVLLEKRDTKVQTLMEEQKEKRKKAEQQVKKLLRQANKKLTAFDEQTNARVTEQVQVLDSHIEIFKGMTPQERMIVVNNEAEKILGPSQTALENIKKLQQFTQHREAVLAEIADELAPASRIVDKVGIELTRAEDELRSVRKNNKRYPELKRKVDELKVSFGDAEKVYASMQVLVKKDKLPLEIAVPKARLFPEGTGDIARLYNVLMYGKDRPDRDTALVENGWFESYGTGMEQDARLNVDTEIYAAVKERKAKFQVDEENSAAATEATVEVTKVAKEALQVMDNLVIQMNTYIERALTLNPSDFITTLRADARLAPSIEAMGLDLIRDKVVHLVADTQKAAEIGLEESEESKQKIRTLAEVLDVLSSEMRIPENKTALNEWAEELRQL